MSDLKGPITRYRPEIEGLRTIATLLVAIYHIWLGKVSGGVDVFFIISGFLITTSLLIKMEKLGSINLVEYFLGLARRLLPLAFTVILITSLLSILFIPQVQWKQIISEIFSSTFYFENWQLSINSIDYLAKHNEASPFQHYWSNSIQGQIFVIWPFIVLLAYFISRKFLKMNFRKTLLAVLVTIFTVSISYSVYITSVNQPWAYFDTFARIWEFSLGGILALLIPYLSFKKSVSFVIGWVGLAIICFTGIILPVSTVFPGYAALLPTTGVMLVLLAAENSSRFGVDKLLSLKPFIFFGSFSYGFYLWHWPLLILYYAYMGTDSVSLQGGIAILLMTFVLSILSTKIIETPVRKINIKQSKIKLTTVLLSFLLPVLIVSISWGVYMGETKDNPNEEYNIAEYPGARSISDHIVPPTGIEPIPSTAHVKEDLPAFYGYPGCVTEKSTVVTCSFGETEDPDYTIALVGGSHSGHWFPALEEMSKELKIKLDVYNHDGCRFTDDDFNGVMTDACMEWNENLIDILISNPPDLVFTTANVNSGDTIPVGYLSQWKKLEGITEILAVRDNPRMLGDIPMCVDQEENLYNCSMPRNEALSETPPWENTDGIPSNVTFADLSEYFCDDDTCYPVIGNVIVYRDNNHITTAYSKTLAPALKIHIKEALEH
ncbi:acyltransferase family protein [Psychrobacillus sp. FSL H8-0483]|uniref:acyltransferase family protein n=1 Tax=Psychrobacillus sp. FSL H8-0483 TaxID=2921389 RepID=UPI00315AB0B1